MSKGYSFPNLKSCHTYFCNSLPIYYMQIISASDIPFVQQPNDNSNKHI